MDEVNVQSMEGCSHDSHLRMNGNVLQSQTGQSIFLGKAEPAESTHSVTAQRREHRRHTTELYKNKT
jgi:hypothetical protein